MKKIIYINDDLYIVLGTALAKVTKDTEQLKKQYSLADAVLRNGKKYYICMKAIDAEFKLNMINDIIASKEMYIGRYYFDKKKWIAAINRFRTVVDEFDQTIYTEEALHRLVEIHYILGLKNESKKCSDRPDRHF